MMDLNKGHSFNIHILISLVMFSSVIKISGSPAASNCICSPNQDPSPYVIFLIYNKPYLFRTKTIFLIQLDWSRTRRSGLHLYRSKHIEKYKCKSIF